MQVGALKELIDLQEISLEGNKITELGDGLLWGPVAMVSMELGNNNLETLHWSSFISITKDGEIRYDIIFLNKQTNTTDYYLTAHMCIECHIENIYRWTLTKPQFLQFVHPFKNYAYYQFIDKNLEFYVTFALV